MAKLGLLPRLYLLSYNVCQFCGWAYCLWIVGRHVVLQNNLEGAYDVGAEAVGFFQLLSALEIIHAAVGLVGGSPVSAAMQWAGRSNVLFGVIAAVPDMQWRPAVGAMFLAWALSEVIRYPWYAANVMGVCPRWLTWLRYTAFIVLYPIGVAAEMQAVWDALPFIKERDLRSIRMPNQANFAFDYYLFLRALLYVYPVLWFQLYTFLLKQRRKKLGPAADGEAAAKKDE